MQHLAGSRLPRLVLPASDATAVDPSALAGLAVIFCYPWTGRPGTPNPPRWDDIPGAHGSTPQALAYSAVYGQFRALSAAVFGVSLQDTGWQREFALRCGLPFPLLSDAARQFSRALGLPTFKTGGQDYLARLTLIARDGVVVEVRYPVASPERDAADVLTWLASM